LFFQRSVRHSDDIDDDLEHLYNNLIAVLHAPLLGIINVPGLGQTFVFGDFFARQI
jgi:hypothetical protein